MNHNNKSNVSFKTFPIKAHVIKAITFNAVRLIFPFFLLATTSVQAEWFAPKTASSLEEAITQGSTQLNFRLRYEDINQGNQGAQALTLKSRLSFETLPYELLTAFVEFDDVRAIPNDDNYNSGVNNQLDDVFLEDPKGTELNQAWIAYDIANTLIKFGRQTLSLNNQRLLGGDSWRQNEQTFSALSIQNETLNYTRFEFVQINTVQTNQAESLASAHQDINAKLLNLNYRGFWLNDLSFYALWISDYAEQKRAETATYGIRFAGDFGDDFSLAYQLELAQQEDAGHNPASYSVGYAMVDFLFAYRSVQAQIGYERLGAESGGFFVTPLGSLHAFQGASDQFNGNGLGNIQGGIQDSYLGLGYSANIEVQQFTLPSSFFVSYHNYRADSSVNPQAQLGEEWNVNANIALDDYQVAIKYADYHAAHFGVNDRHIWLSLSAQF